MSATATPQLPSGKLKPKQSLGQNFLKDPNTVAKIIRAFHEDATARGGRRGRPLESIVELGPGAGALTDRLVENYGTDVVQCIELDPRSVEILEERYPSLVVHHADVLQVNYPAMAEKEGQPLVVIGNLPYYITSQILFALADASHYGAVDCATVTMQWEVAQRMVAPTSCKVCLRGRSQISLSWESVISHQEFSPPDYLFGIPCLFLSLSVLSLSM
jgi:16S rRNA (adenine1518-N6/adenine1519-N6)-dimethyltransferase